MAIVYMNSFDWTGVGGTARKSYQTSAHKNAFIFTEDIAGTLDGFKQQKLQAGSPYWKAHRGITGFVLGFHMRSDNTSVAGTTSADIHIDFNALKDDLSDWVQAGILSTHNDDDPEGAVVFTYTDAGATAHNSSAVTFLEGSWHRLELKVVGHPTAGTVELKYDGISIINQTGINTLAVVSKFVSQKWTAGHVGGHDADISNLYTLDDVAPNNNFLGDVRIYNHLPSSVAENKYTTIGTTDALDALNTLDPQTATKRMEGDVLGDRLTVNFKKVNVTGGIALPAATAVVGTQLNVLSKKDDAGTTLVNALCTDGVNESIGRSIPVGEDSYNAVELPMDRTPDGLVWTQDNVESYTYGCEILEINNE